jgi:hypothetical protein
MDLGPAPANVGGEAVLRAFGDADSAEAGVVESVARLGDADPKVVGIGGLRGSVVRMSSSPLGRSSPLALKPRLRASR